MTITDLLFRDESEPHTTKKPQRRARGWLAFLAVVVPAAFGALTSYYQARGEARDGTDAAYQVIRARQNQLIEAVASLREELLRQRIATLEEARLSEAEPEPPVSTTTRRRAARRRASVSTALSSEPLPAPEPTVEATALPELAMPVLTELPSSLEEAKKQLLKQ